MPPSRPQKYRQDEEELNRLRRFYAGTGKQMLSQGSGGQNAAIPVASQPPKPQPQAPEAACGAGSTAKATAAVHSSGVSAAAAAATAAICESAIAATADDCDRAASTTDVQSVKQCAAGETIGSATTTCVQSVA